MAEVFKTKEEIWKDVDGFDGYQVSNLGRVRCCRDYHRQLTDNWRILNPSIDKDGYFYVTMSRADEYPRKRFHKRVHRIAADTFLGPHPDLVINHIDGNKQNNDINNLEWVTAEENSTRADNSGVYRSRGVEILETGEKFYSIKKCADAIGSDPSDINHFFSGRKNNVKGLSFRYIDNEPKTHPIQKKEKSFLYDYQMDAVNRMHNGCILCGSVGSGKSLTSKNAVVG